MNAQQSGGRSVRRSVAEKKDDDSVVRAYALVGKAAAEFAALEFHLQFLVSLLITSKPIAIEAMLLTRRSGFADKIRIVSEVVPVRFPTLCPLREKIEHLVQELDALRDSRNMFIHGYWLINDILIKTEGLIRCSDPKWKYDKETNEWKSMESHDFHFAALEAMIRRTGATTAEIHSILEQLGKEQRK